MPSQVCVANLKQHTNKPEGLEAVLCIDGHIALMRAMFKQLRGSSVFSPEVFLETELAAGPLHDQEAQKLSRATRKGRARLLPSSTSKLKKHMAGEPR